jgi:peroxiredoxin Q/BCP
MKALRRIAQKRHKKLWNMLGKPVPDFSLHSTGGSTFKLSSARGAKLVLYFYPKDNTPGCTKEGADFRDHYRDSLRSHEGFKAKNMYGRKVRGIERSTFVVAANGVLAREWRGVKVPGHVQEVLNFVKAL